MVNQLVAITWIEAEMRKTNKNNRPSFGRKHEMAPSLVKPPPVMNKKERKFIDARKHNMI
jgi:hypothetical protein